MKREGSKKREKKEKRKRSTDVHAASTRFNFERTLQEGKNYKRKKAEIEKGGKKGGGGGVFFCHDGRA